MSPEWQDSAPAKVFWDPVYTLPGAVLLMRVSSVDGRSRGRKYTMQLIINIHIS